MEEQRASWQDGVKGHREPVPARCPLSLLVMLPGGQAAGQAGLVSGWTGPGALAWLLLVWACLAERSRDRVVAGPGTRCALGRGVGFSQEGGWGWSCDPLWQYMGCKAVQKHSLELAGRVPWSFKVLGLSQQLQAGALEKEAFAKLGVGWFILIF